LNKVLHLQYYAKLFIGESATMASECACLGTPAIFVSTSVRGYTNEQGRQYGLVFTCSDPSCMEGLALEKAEEILGQGTRNDWRDRAEKLLADKIDVTIFMADLVEKYARS
jgi:predicted glycosyltransferase